MNIVVGMLFVIAVLLLVKPAQAGNRMLVDNFIPAVMQSSFRVPFLSEVLANRENRITAVDGSAASATVTLQEVARNLDTKITIKAMGLNPGEQYVPIYYQNSDCSVEINSFDKSIQGAFFASDKGEGEVEDVVKDSVNRIGSVSLRKAKDFELVACGRV